MHDVIVIGTGGIGSATLFSLATSGLKVLGIDRFQAGHDRGSSHGQTRIIRRSYFEHTHYVPLLNLAYQRWDELCQISGEQLFHRTGLIYVGDEADDVVHGVRRSAADHRLEIEDLTTAQAAARFPGFVVPEKDTILYESDAGYLRVEEAVRTSIRQAQRCGAETIHDCEVVGWSATDTSVVVDTKSGRFEAAKLVITAGCWARSLLIDLQVPLQVIRKHLHWFEHRDDRYRQSQGCPCFFYATDRGYFYGFPDRGNDGLKVAMHSGGTQIRDPLIDDRAPERADTADVGDFVRRFLPGVSSHSIRHDVCFYTMTPDAHFVIDRHPAHPNVVFAAGMSGHGFKFAPAIGQILTELTLNRAPSAEISFLSLNRFE